MTHTSPLASSLEAGTGADTAQAVQTEAAGMAVAVDDNNAPFDATKSDLFSLSFLENHDIFTPGEAGKAKKTRTRASGKSASKKSATKRRATSGAKARQVQPLPVKEWTTPVPFATRSLPRLDCSKLPAVLGDFCRGLSSEMQIPEENVLASALAVVATCAQTTYSVELYGTSTIQTTNLFIMSPLPPSSRKRACLKACLNPIRDWEEAQVREIGPRITQENIKKMITRRSIRSLAKDAVKAQVAKDEETFQALLRQIYELQVSLDTTTIVPQLVTGTLAGLEETVHQQHDTLTFASAEDNCLDILSSASTRSAKDLVAQAWNAGQHTVKTKNRAYTMHPRLTMALSPQKNALADPRKVKLLQSRGLDTRFIYFMPADARTLAKCTRMPKEVANAFFENVLRLLPASWNEPEESRMLTLSPDAELKWLEYREKAEMLCQGLDISLQEWTTRLASDFVGRIAALFHLVSCADPRTDLVISSEEMEQALSLGDLLFEHARAAFGLMLQDSPEEAANKVLDLVTRNGWSVFSARECFQSLRGQALFRTMKPLNSALEALMEHGYIRTISVPGKSGKLMERFELNPAVAQPKAAAASEKEFLVYDILKEAGVEREEEDTSVHSHPEEAASDSDGGEENSKNSQQTSVEGGAPESCKDSVESSTEEGAPFATHALSLLGTPTVLPAAK
ncbi:hypothetical protein B5F76_06750 [Desulfovibrio sp. An276]|uniref:DUF3987 domain-containing protein n=1 Tax=Desulfovibrio sp. An276 TaxID=1965618 RepID=UPI000B3A049D|nr:DUF3987 domain-containing protein [Desulfovibrio sp. An276]OUO52827.1 hypothetical protein B5F76_06750 [Desulfovibrio sp. An276]